ncbi:MAG: hypothetical protein QJR06_09675 [Alicyclobacillaceae bacterium]|nr:hypothetical protein [Alicyclobacillaceae bacterium]
MEYRNKLGSLNEREVMLEKYWEFLFSDLAGIGFGRSHRRKSSQKNDYIFGGSQKGLVRSPPEIFIC